MEPKPLVDTLVLGRATANADHRSALDRRRRRTAAGGAALLVASALAAAGWAIASGPGSDSDVQPPRPEGPARNGALVSIIGTSFVPVRGAIPDADGPDAEEAARLTSFHVNPTSPVSFSADGTLMLVQDQDGSLVLRDLWTGEARTVGACAPRWCAATLSPDGTTVALAADSGTGRGIDLLAVSDGTTEHLSLSGMVAYTPSWSPDGTRLAFVGKAGIHVVGRDGSGLRLVSPAVPPPSDRPSWSPDGSRLTFVRWEPESFDLGAEMWAAGAADHTLVVLDVGSGVLDELRDVGTCLCLHVPWPQAVWSPDGSLIAVVTVHERPGGVGTARGGGVWVVHPDGSGWRQVSALPPGTRLAWHPLVD